MINELVNGLDNTGLTNLRGVAAAYFIDITGIYSMPDIKARLKSFNAEMSISDISLVIGAPIMPLSNDNTVSIEFKEDEKGSPQNPFFSYSVDLSLGNDDEATRGQLLRAFDNRQWIVIVQQATGAWRMLGSMKRGCDFKSSFTSGTQVKGQSLFKCAFTWEAGYRAFYLTPPDFAVINITSVSYDSIGATTDIAFMLSNFSGTQSGRMQIFINGAWLGLDSYTLGTGSYSGTVGSALPSGTYYFRIVHQGGICSNTVTFTV